MSAVAATGANAATNANNAVLALKEADLKMMLAAKVHLGTKNADPQAHRYIWRRRPDGVHIINLGKTWQKILLAARVIAAIENPEDVVVVSSRQFGQRSVFKFAQHTGAQYVGGRYTPGTFTNQVRIAYTPRPLDLTRFGVESATDSHTLAMPVFIFYRSRRSSSSRAC